MMHTVCQLFAYERGHPGEGVPIEAGEFYFQDGELNSHTESDYTAPANYAHNLVIATNGMTGRDTIRATYNEENFWANTNDMPTYWLKLAKDFARTGNNHHHPTFHNPECVLGAMNVVGCNGRVAAALAGAGGTTNRERMVVAGLVTRGLDPTTDFSGLLTDITNLRFVRDAHYDLCPPFPRTTPNVNTLSRVGSACS